MKDLLCIACNAPIKARLGEITSCTACAAPFVCVEAYCHKESNCECYQFFSYSQYREKTSLLSSQEFPAQVKGAQTCWGCGFSWGVSTFAIEKPADDGRRPFDGFLIVPLERFDELTVYHGTTRGAVGGFIREGFRVPRHIGEKSHGFSSEESLRYTGRDIQPAKNHTPDETIIEFLYTGFIAVTALTCVGADLNSLMKRLPLEIGGIQYQEDGRSIAFRPEASLNLISGSVEKFSLEAPSEGLFSGIKQSLKKWLAKIGVR